jgi:hypothetical protein
VQQRHDYPLSGAGSLIWYPSIIIGTDGLALISYYRTSDNTLGWRTVPTCCSSAAFATLDSSGDGVVQFHHHRRRWPGADQLL